MTDDAPDHAPWPFERQDPTKIVLAPREGAKASEKPPVRIFLGTEEAQYRAERIFFYSVEKFRDPARCYEIYLMKNVSGFDRRKWRTGFTNYRYAIPEFAGGQGRAIYNDVDQIYLADPALLFDLDMHGHGYLAISAKDTSVMLMDCAAMLPMWNRKTAATLGKHELIAKPSQTKGLWGALDGHWNARDQEYAEDLTKCLHYTALHQQPWEPFPDDYSYHPNPLAYLWHDLEREADAQDYQLFSSGTPSPEFEKVAAALGSDTTELPWPPQARQLFQSLNIATVLLAHTSHGRLSQQHPQDWSASSLAVHKGTDWPHKQADAIVADGLPLDIPPADLPWLLDKLFQAARQLVYLRLPKTFAQGLGSVDWWALRMRQAARRHPEVHWRLDALDAKAELPGTVRSIQVMRQPGKNPRIWILATGQDATDQAMTALARELDAEANEIRPGQKIPNGLPDMILTADLAGGNRALAMKRESGTDLRHVHFGHHGLKPKELDLLITTSDERVPIRPNVLHACVMPLQPPQAVEGGPLMIVLKPLSGYSLDLEAFEKALQASGREGRFWVEAGVSSALKGRLASLGDYQDVSEQPLEPLAAGAEKVLVGVDQRFLIMLAANAGRKVELIDQPSWRDRYPALKPLLNLATLLAGGGTSYRGTPHQQHFVARSIDKRVIERGWRLPNDPARLHKALIGRGLAAFSGASGAMASPHPLDDRQRILQRMRELLSETVTDSLMRDP